MIRADQVAGATDVLTPDRTSSSVKPASGLYEFLDSKRASEMVTMKKICGLSLVTRRAAIRLAVFFVVASLPLGWAYMTMIHMPGTSFRGALPRLTEVQLGLRDSLRDDVEMLAGEIGPQPPLILQETVETESKEHG